MREIYKGRVIEVRPGGRGHSRIWHVFIDGIPLTYARYSVDEVKRSYGSADAGVRVARECVDSEFASFSWQCRSDPAHAVEWCTSGLERAQRKLVHARKSLSSASEWSAGQAQQRVKDAELETNRWRADLDIAKRAFSESNKR